MFGLQCRKCNLKKLAQQVFSALYDCARDEKYSN